MSQTPRDKVKKMADAERDRGKGGGREIRYRPRSRP